MKATVFQNGKPVEISIEADNNEAATAVLNELVLVGYISGFLMLLQKEDE